MNPWQVIARKLAYELSLVNADADPLWRFHEMQEADASDLTFPGYHTDYPSEPIGGGNPYYRCVYCKGSDPSINGDLENHDDYCQYRIRKTEELKNKFLMDIINQ